MLGAIICSIIIIKIIYKFACDLALFGGLEKGSRRLDPIKSDPKELERFNVEVIIVSFVNAIKRKKFLFFTIY